ncbi:MAG TPA: sigma 54-interacting transcriptional regulator, partial [Gammaproteobacteria bacterium]
EPIGRSRQFQSLRQQALQIAQHDTAVLLSGEPGSGKHLFARYLHDNSARRQGPFIIADVSAQNHEGEHLSRLFGQETEGQVHYGLLDQAHGGSLYIDDVADLDHACQSRLLQLLRNSQFLRQQGSVHVDADVRIIAASRHSLEQLIGQQRFREDLYYELNVVSLYIPALREHSDDVLDLIAYYNDYFVETDKLPYRSFTTAALNRLRQYSWPGNVRELKNLIQRLLIVGREQQIDLDEVEETLGQQHRAPATEPALAAYDMPIRQAREQFERSYFDALMRRYEGSVNKVAQHAQMERTHLYRKLRSLGIDPKSYSH